MNAFAGAIDALFADPNIGKDAIWRAGGAGGGVGVRVVLNRPDQITNFNSGRFVSKSVSLDVRLSDIETLASGDTFEIGNASYEIIGEPIRDDEQLIWQAEAREI